MKKLILSALAFLCFTAIGQAQTTIVSSGFSGPSGAVSSFTMTTPTLAVGDLIVVAAGAESTANTLAISDNVNGSYTVKVTSFSNALNDEMVGSVVTNGTAGTVTITVTLSSGTARMYGTYLVIRGGLGYDVSGFNASTNSQSVTLGSNSDVVLALNAGIASGDMSAASGYTLIGGNAFNSYWGAEYKYPVGGSPTVAFGSTGVGGVVVLAVKGTPPNPTCNAGWPSYSTRYAIIPATSGASVPDYLGNTYRAGFKAQLDGSASSSGDGSGLKYFWRFIGPPSGVSDIKEQTTAFWDSQYIQKPTLNGLQAGAMDIELTVSDIGDGLSSSCIIHDGVVATDSNNTVLSDGSSLGNAISKILGNPVAFQKNPWLWYDEMLYDAIPLQAGQYDLSKIGTPNNYTLAGTGSWGQASTHGLVSSVTGSACSGSCIQINGNSSTQFDVDLCGGSGATAFGGSNTDNQFVLWYLTGRTLPNSQPEIGRMPFNQGTCSGPHTIFVNFSGGGGEGFGATWPGDATPIGGLNIAASGAQVNLQYSVFHFNGCTSNNGSCWWASAQPIYYDPIQAFYMLWFRSQISIFRQWAREFADIYYQWPGSDMTVAMNGGSYSTCVNLENCLGLNFGGLMLRAFDSGDSKNADMWAQLHHGLWNFAWRMISGVDSGLRDLRVSATHLMPLAYAAMLDPSSGLYSNSWCPACSSTLNYGGSGGISWPQFYRTAIHNALSALWTPWRDAAEAGWLSWNINGAGFSSYDGSQTWTGHTATISTSGGVSTVTCANCGWSQALFQTKFDPSTGSDSSCSSGATCIYPPMVFCTASSLTGQSTDCETRSYCFPNGCTWVSTVGTTVTIQLDTPHVGSDGTYNWVFSTNNTPGYGGNGPIAVAGYTGNVYMEGIAAAGFQLASQACSGTPAGCQSGDDTTYAGYANDATNWILNYATVTPNNPFYGVAYTAGGMCNEGATPPLTISPSNYACLYGGSGNPGYSKEILGDAVVGLFREYPNSTQQAVLGTFLDKWYAAMWGKSGIGSPPVNSPDGSYDSLFDSSGCTLNATWPYVTGSCGYYLTAAPGSPLISQKVLAQHTGISNEANWPTVRLGGPIAAANKTVNVSAKLADVATATKYVVVMVDPFGQTSNTTCSSSPCSVTINSTPGNWKYYVQYQNSSSVTVATSGYSMVVVN